ncbi:Lrp/AsnC family transcriptional regulator [Alkalihalophilus marmarensis]|uniref:Heat-inducible transcription repressor HrcA n=1 Tax=Alkalihalophilus marmarensis DSM 21297 TaxID=1188261 RepID=U6SKY4_9BACI|nr:Lrp/AsnC family transcriptional regulator [Alkalihalophilus marmarensis]ERN51580.1 hypothetical protein A33I_19805 [Alkalihalophilus marmarensis DSM 21297]MCM3490749.1 Lrp/AsnC family transcriptional regulator [Alkalihalophilus marmarensis]
MSLTNRRKQFLEELVHIYAKTNEPIHYSEIAKTIGVSKWTAYDILKELEKHQFLEKTYSVNPNETGRSLVVFVPTEKSKDMFLKERVHITSEDEWTGIKENVLAFIHQTKSLDNQITPLLERMPHAPYKIEVCAQFLGVLLVYLNNQGSNVQHLTLNMLNISKNPAIQLSTFVGAVTGMIIESASETISPEMVELLRQFTHALEELKEEELIYLIHLLEDLRA